VRCAIVILLLLPLVSAAVAQEQQPVKSGVCVQDKSVDDYIAELRKLEKERKKSTHNPLPNNVCIFGMCSHPPGGPGEDQEAKRPPSPQPEPPAPAQQSTNGSESSSKQNDVVVPDKLEAPPTYDPIAAAHNADVGDYYLQQKNYRAALMRYEDARQSKPGDAAIHVRMGRALEKLDEPARAYLEYDSATKLEPAGKSEHEARDAMERLRKMLQSKGNDPDTLSKNNEPEPAPCLHPASK
jgi:tetratricopeptide (TPR) repeat protein